MMKARFAIVLAFVLTACVGSLTIVPQSNVSATPTPRISDTPDVITIHVTAPPISSQPSAGSSPLPSERLSSSPSAVATVRPTASPTPTPTPTPRPKTLWTQVVPGIEVMDDSVLEFPGSNGAMIKPRKISGVAVHTGAPRTPDEGAKELWIQFNDVDGGASFVAYDVTAATWSVRASAGTLKCPGSMYYEDGYVTAPCHPDDYPLLVNQYSVDNWKSTYIAATPIVTAQSSQSFTVQMQQSTERWYGVSYTRIINSTPVVTVPITEDFTRVLYAPDYYAYYKDERGVAAAGHSAWYNERLYYATMYRTATSLEAFWNQPRVVAWWSKSDNTWRVTELPFVKNEGVRGVTGYLRSSQPLYMAVDPNSNTFFFVVPEQRVRDTTGPWGGDVIPYLPQRFYGTLYKVSASFIHDNGVLVSVK